MKKRHITSSLTNLSPIKNTPTKYFSIPYIPNISEQLSYYFKTLCPEIRITFSTSNNKLKSAICMIKDKLDPLKTHGIYRLNCPCGKFYIGRTIRNFTVRSKEHIAQTRNHLNRGTHITSAFSNHLVDSGHLNSIGKPFNPQILHSGGNTDVLNSLECLEILLNKKHNTYNILNNITEFTHNRFIP